ncbi:MAG: hypothetical protein JKY42_06115 [Flavobacteriales bacterium]|nr:hypothetical protein [Flavobacteriales bacterium]
MSNKLTGITIQKTKISQAFTLISFMVGELIFDGTVEAPVQVSRYPNLDKDHFHDLRAKMMSDLATKKEIMLDVEESLLLYLIVDMVCKCFVSDANVILREKAEENMEIDAEEYKQVSLSYIHYAQSLLNEMNEKFDGDPTFDDVHEKLNHWRK